MGAALSLPDVVADGETRRPRPKLAEFGFPVPPPPPSGTVPEPAAIGGVSYQPFPDPRTGGETTVLPDIRDLFEAAESAPGRRVPRPSHPSSSASALSFAPSSHTGGRLGSDAPSAAVRPSSPDVDPPSRESSAEADVSGHAGAGVPSPGAGVPGVGVGLPGLAGAGVPGLAGSGVLGPVVRSDQSGVAGREASGHSGGSERGVGRRNLRRSAGHRAPDDDPGPTEAEQLSLDSAVSSSGRHTVPDELVQAATYRLPPDRVFRAKVRDAGTPHDDPTTTLVPKPRQS